MEQEENGIIQNKNDLAAKLADRIEKQVTEFLTKIATMVNTAIVQNPLQHRGIVTQDYLF